MHLLNTTTFTFGEFFDSQVPVYCILSHRWGNDEVDHAQIRDQRVRPETQGYRKVYGACQLASQREFDWIWIDTCCIDKTSSAELTEAINSMFDYYSKARLCIAYLNDVANTPNRDQRAVQRRRMETLRRSAWFTRGWTLQELLAPTHVEFFDRDFRFIGSKAQLSRALSEITGIASRFLDGRYRIHDASVATRMSWASNRETTRLEDQAYSLLGIFGVNMPLLYGEGKRAFFRLQQQILEHSDDESIFAWIAEGAHDDEPFGMLAESPRNFRWSQYVRQIRLTGDTGPPCSWTSRGLQFSRGYEDDSCQLGYSGKVPIACRRLLGKKPMTVAVWLRKIHGSWYRFFCGRFHYTTEKLWEGSFQTFYIPQPNLTATPRLQWRRQKEMTALVRDRMRQGSHQYEKREAHETWEMVGEIFDEPSKFLK